MSRKLELKRKKCHILLDVYSPHLSFFSLSFGCTRLKIINSLVLCKVGSYKDRRIVVFILNEREREKKENIFIFEDWTENSSFSL